MASGVEGLLILSIGVRVSPEPGAIEFIRRYNVALNYAVNKILSLTPLTAPQMTDVNPNRWGSQ